ncbi:uncharacterized protein F4807DRAFT_471628 [Annulohypoxylon truncatum]|uniref:uncharacterized protein n=1 Tax=Annulohypoxylon truncatum TaxID=327061 RepID=UPI002007E3C4|nr:uncharacterized protein F4807DRAFT_471628 [Annulohypoxylon truncatum]KAI1213170.1 hypothetical protein F4807DRAFT_471628 [Annulohypoxylon truncatum]
MGPSSRKSSLKAMSRSLMMGMLTLPLLVSGSAIPTSSGVTRGLLSNNNNTAPHNVTLDTAEPQWIASDRVQMLRIVINAIRKNRALGCKPIDPEDIYDRMERFTKKEIRGDETWARALTRLVQYKIFQQSIPGDADQATFATITATIRGLNDEISEPASLMGGFPRVLDALDPILNDICNQTESSKVDRRLQEIVDIVQVGLHTPLPPHQALSPPPLCHCLVHGNSNNGTECPKAAIINWNPNRVGGWECLCVEECQK